MPTAALPKPSASARRFEWHSTVDEGLEAMLEAIRQARRSVCLETYIFAASPIGEQFRDALTEAAARGVQVRALIDAWGSLDLMDSFWNPLVQAGGKFRWFNPIHLKRCGFRNHRKLLVCDGEIAFVGGFNIAPEYQGDGVTQGWRDFGLKIEGPLVESLARSFERMYEVADFGHRRFTALRRTQWRSIESTEDGQLILGGPGRGRNFLGQSLLADLSEAKHVRLMCGYFLPTRPMRRALIRCARRGARVQLILAGETDVPLARLACHRFYRTFLKNGIEVYEYQPQILHAKLFIFDDVVYTGSTNLDRRSGTINYDLLVRLPQAEAAREAAEMFDADLARCRRIEWSAWRASRTFWTKIMERFAFFFLARFDPYFARHQLKALRLHAGNESDSRTRSLRDSPLPRRSTHPDLRQSPDQSVPPDRT